MAMKVVDVEAVFRALQAGGVRYIVVGGAAVIAHGYGRLTHDLDLVVQLAASNIVAAFEALAALGYRPIQPVTAAQFADPALRRSWIEHKNMVVLNLWSDSRRETKVDIFVTEPFDFDTEYAGASRIEFVPGLSVPFASMDTLIRMKEAVGRPRDLDDAWHLKKLKQELARGEKED